MKKQNLDSEVTRNFTIEMAYYVQFRIVLKKGKHVKFCDFRYGSCSLQALYLAHVLRYTTLFLKKKLVLLACFAVSKYACLVN